MIRDIDNPERFSSPMVYGGGRSVTSTFSLSDHIRPRASPAMPSNTLPVPLLNLGGKMILNWFSIVITGFDFDQAASTTESFESETTKLGLNRAMAPRSKASCLRNPLNMRGKRGRMLFDANPPSAVHSTSRGGLASVRPPSPTALKWARPWPDDENRMSNSAGGRRRAISRERVACPIPEPKTAKYTLRATNSCPLAPCRALVARATSPPVVYYCLGWLQRPGPGPGGSEGAPRLLTLPRRGSEGGLTSKYR